MSEDKLENQYQQFCDSHISCKDCEYENINNCRMLFAYDKGRRDTETFVESKCKELDIDYTLIFTCEKGE